MFSIMLVVTAGILSAAADTTAEQAPAVITLEQALEIALSNNPTVRIADLEIHRANYARKGSYASLLPQINAIPKAAEEEWPA